MNQRLQQFLSAENISQAQFADTIEVARASVSHVLAGRNKPGYDFIKSISDHYPRLNLDWLINGKGRMYKDSPTPAPAPVPAAAQAAQPAPQPVLAPPPTADYTDDLFASERPSAVENPFRAPEPAPKIDSPTESRIKTEATKSINNQRRISKIIVFFDDDTFQELK